jgi:hypothetical protein
MTLPKPISCERMTASGRCLYEVDTEFLQLTDASGQRHFLRRGANLPTWVPADQIQALLESGAIVTIEVT